MLLYHAVYVFRSPGCVGAFGGSLSSVLRMCLADSRVPGAVVESHLPKYSAPRTSKFVLLRTPYNFTQEVPITEYGAEGDDDMGHIYHTELTLLNLYLKLVCSTHSTHQPFRQHSHPCCLRISVFQISTWHSNHQVASIHPSIHSFIHNPLH